MSQHLLPRLFGFELLMAPYTVAHMKLGLQLQELGYDFACLLVFHFYMIMKVLLDECLPRKQKGYYKCL